MSSRAVTEMGTVMVLQRFVDVVFRFWGLGSLFVRAKDQGQPLFR